MNIYSRLDPPIQYVDMLKIACKNEPIKGYNMRYHKQSPNNFEPLTKHEE